MSKAASTQEKIHMVTGKSMTFNDVTRDINVSQL